MEWLNMTYALEINNLGKTYANGFNALKQINLTVPEGDFFALLGPNGAGKSTILGIISSLIRKTQGQVSIFGHSVDKELSLAKHCVGVVPQEFNFNIFEQVMDVILNQAGYYGIPRSEAMIRGEQLLQQLGLWDKRHAICRQLSGGMKRRLMIARALIHQPRMLILDEPTAGVDIELRRSMWEFLTKINQQGTTIILTTQYLEEAENLCRNIAIIDLGEIIQNTSMQMLLRTLNRETFILDLTEPCAAAQYLANFDGKQINDQQLEIQLTRKQDLNSVFSILSQQGVQVSSMRNKANRLEELFINLVGKIPSQVKHHQKESS
jgi:ABC-2 type transport system ATP-binding protein